MLLREFAELRKSEGGIGSKRALQIDWAIGAFERWADRAVAVNELSDKLINDHLAWMESSEMRPGSGKLRSSHTVENRKRLLLALWRSAYDRDPPLVTTPPKRIRRVASVPIIVRTWTQGDVDRLLAAASKVSGYFEDTGIKRAPFWCAVIRIGWTTGLRLGDYVWHPVESPWALRFTEIGEDGTVVRTQHKTSAVLACKLHASDLDALDQTLPPYREVCLPWLKGMAYFHKAFRAIRSAAGINSGTIGDLRKSSSTAVESMHPGAAPRHLGHAPGSRVAYVHYVDPHQTSQARPMPPELRG